MRSDQVPQDNSSSYAGHKKLLYAQTDAGDYVGVKSSGWEVETAATYAAVEEFAQLAQDALRAVKAGTHSPLYYHMYASRMDLLLLAQVSGLWRWRIKRHFQPKHFARLSGALLDRYAEVFDIPRAQLQTTPDA
jgi:hypothetical protein